MMIRLYTFVIVGAAAVAAAQGSTAGSEAAYPQAQEGAKSPVRAMEDTVVYAIDTVRVEAKRVPLIDIIRRARDGERRKYDG
jgi:hypothetical protein